MVFGILVESASPIKINSDEKYSGANRNVFATSPVHSLHPRGAVPHHRVQEKVTLPPHRTEYVDRFQDLSQLFEQYSSKQDNDQNISIMFAIACRSYSRIFLKANEHDIFNVRAFLGNRLQLLEKVQLDQLNISGKPCIIQTLLTSTPSSMRCILAFS